MNIRRCGKGVTLVEVLISMCILLIVFMGLIQASIVTINSNLRNEVRDTGVSIASDTMSRLRALSFGDAALDDTTSLPAPSLVTVSTITRQFRNTSVDYTVRKKVVDYETPALHKRVIVQVTWRYPGEDTDRKQEVVSTVNSQ